MEDTKAEQKKQIQKEIMSLSTAILAGAVIVGLAVLLGANMMVDKLGGQGATQLAGGVAGAPTGNDNLIAEIADRKTAPKEGAGKVIVQEFSDFQCPFCQKFWNESYKQIKKDYIDTNKITFIYRHFPLGFHANAQKAAEAAECANLQDKFWAYHDILFTKGKADGTGLDVQSLKLYAKEAGLNAPQFNSCLDENKTADIVDADTKEGQKAGVTGTPTFFINGKRLVGALPYAEFKKVIEEALK